MKRLSLLLSAATLVAIVAPVGVVQAGCIPVDNGTLQTFCQVLGAPQTACRAAVYQVTTNPAVPAAVRTLVAGAGLCERVPTGLQLAGQDAQVFHLGNSVVVQNDFTVGIDRTIYIHNFDGNQHSFTDPGCLDGLSGTPCRFNRLLQIGDWVPNAESVSISSPTFKVGTPYAFKCRFHPNAGEAGTFTVSD